MPAFEGNTLTQSPDGLKRGVAQFGPRPAWIGQRVDARRQPRVDLPRKVEPLRHHTDDGRQRAIGPDDLAHDLGVAVETIEPGAMTEQHHRWCRLVILRGSEGPSEERLNAQEIEERRADPRPGVSDRLPFGAADVHRHDDVGRERLEASLLLPPILEVVNRHRHERQVLGRSRPADRDQSFGIVVRKSADQEPIDDAEHRHGEADPESQRHHGREAQSRAPEQHPCSEEDVLEDRAHRHM